MMEPHSGVVSSLSSTATLINCMCGAGLVALPFCFFSCGVGLAFVTLAVVGLACRFSFSLLLHCRQLSRDCRTYEELAEQALGHTGRMCVRWSEAALNLGTTVALLNILADVLSSVAGSLIPPGAEPSRNAYVTGVTVLGALPVSIIVRDPKSVSALSTASVGFAFVFALACSVMAITSPSAADMSELRLWRFDGLPVAFPVFAYAFSAHSDLLSVYYDLRRPTSRRMQRVTDMALTIATSLYAIVGMAGYMQYQSRTSGDLLRNLGGNDQKGIRGAYERALKACYGLSVLAMMPLMVAPFYQLLLPLPSHSEMGSAPLSHRPGGVDTGWLDTVSVWIRTVLGIPTSAPPRRRRIKPAKSSDFSPDHTDLHRDLSPDNSHIGSTGSHAGVGPEGASPGSIDRSQSRALQAAVPTLNRRAAGRLLSDGSHGTPPTSGSDDSPPSLTLVNPLLAVTGGVTAAVTHTLNPAASRTASGRPPRATGKGDMAGDADVSDSSDTTLAKQGPHKTNSGPMLAATAYPRPMDISSYWLFHAPSFWQHSYSVVIVMGVALACTSFVPNAEFIMGLTGSTSCLMLSYVLPPATLIKLMDACPEFNGKGFVHGGPVLPPDMRRTWEWRRRGAVVLLVFGVFTGIVCTAAVLGAVREEATVVQLAQELVGVEVVMQQTAQGKAKAQQALTTVQAVEEAALELTRVQVEANSTLDRLNQAAASLTHFTGEGAGKAGQATPTGQSDKPPEGSTAGGSGFGLNKWVEERKQAAQDSKTLKGVEAQLMVAKTEVASSADTIRNIIKQLDAAKEALAKEQARADAEAANATTAIQAAATAQSGKAGSGGGSSGADGGSGSSVSQLVTGNTQEGARARAGQLAAELHKALQSYASPSGKGKEGSGDTGASEPTRPLDQVRANAVATLGALSQTAFILEKVSEVVANARKASHKDADIRREAALAMREALNATQTSALALSITQQVLAASAAQEADELIAALTKVASEIQSARKSQGAVAHRIKPSPSPSPPQTLGPLPSPVSATTATTTPPSTTTSDTAVKPTISTDTQSVSTVSSLPPPPPAVTALASPQAVSSDAQKQTQTQQPAQTDATLVGNGQPPLPVNTTDLLRLKQAPMAAPSALTADKLQAIEKAVELLDKATDGAISRSDSGAGGSSGTGASASGAASAAAGGSTSAAGQATVLPTQKVAATDTQQITQQGTQQGTEQQGVQQAVQQHGTAQQGTQQQHQHLKGAGSMVTIPQQTGSVTEATQANVTMPAPSLGAQKSAQDVIKSVLKATEVVLETQKTVSAQITHTNKVTTSTSSDVPPAA